MADERDEIRSRIDIVDLIEREGVRLKKTGKNFTGLCPFHNERRPSFTVNSETGRYKCFSCGESGDVFTWVMKRQNVEFVEALHILASIAGVTLRRDAGESKSSRELYQAIMDESLAFYREQFSRSTVAQEYCKRRELSADVLAEWQIGYAPDVGEALATHLKRKGLPLAEAKSVFVVDQDGGGGYFDKFRGRLIFPIRDEKGALVAFGGRLLGDGHPKYINSGDTPIYRKSRVLYGMNRSREALTATRRAVLCEGYLDVIACHTAGVKSAIASLGTSLTEDHARLLKRWCDEVVILYDSDPAGQKASSRAVEVLRPEGLRVRVAAMPEGDDPDTLLRRVGPEAVRRSVESGLSPVDYHLLRIGQTLKPEQEEYWTAAIEALAEAETEPELARHIDRLAGEYPGTRDISRAADAIRVQVAKVRRSRNASKKAAASEERTPTPRRPMPVAELHGQLLGAERIIFRAFLDHGFRRVAFNFARFTPLYESGIGRRLSAAITEAFPSGAPEGPPSSWLTQIAADDARNWLGDIHMHPWDEPLTETVLADAITILQNRHARRQRTEALRAGAKPEAVFDQLRAAKPDTRAKPKEVDDLF